MCRIMVMNLGSTSFKFKYFPGGAEKEPAASGVFEGIGRQESPYRITFGSETLKGAARVENHRAAFAIAAELLKRRGILRSPEELDAVCYKAVHAGAISGVQPVDDSLMEVMRRFCSFAPAHNTVYLAMMAEMRKAYPGLFQLACFETSFHASIPRRRTVYGVPLEWEEELGIRKYGFHGSSHRYIADRMAQLAPQCRKLLSLHLGGSSSVCAIENGKSIACSMGATPQSGLFQNNRVGDFDVFCLPALLRRYNGNLESVMRVLSEKSGLLGVSGVSSDMREILDAAHAGNERAQLAVDAYIDGIIGYIGMFNAYLGGTDAVVFTGGIGFAGAEIRPSVCRGLGWLGVRLDEEKNCQPQVQGCVSLPGSAAAVYVLETNEELTLAHLCEAYLREHPQRRDS
jgi:acetate kinase